MTDLRFGGSAGLLQRLRPTRIDVADLLDVADRLLPTVAVPGLRVELVQRAGAGSLLILEEDERTVRTPLVDLADDMTHDGVTATPTGIAAALAAWIVRRPVTDRQAARTGIAVLDWADRRQTAIGWRVVVQRGEIALPWTPSADAEVPVLRAAAAGRAVDVPLELRVEGPVALWSHPTVPVLATSVLIIPERMLSRLAATGLDPAGMHVVVTPHRPVACAGPGIAARLAGETTEASVTLPWSRLPDLPWL
jgi:hypothetical protein